MDEKVFNVSFYIWASNENEAYELGREIGSFIDEQGRNGRNVTTIAQRVRCKLRFIASWCSVRLITPLLEL